MKKLLIGLSLITISAFSTASASYTCSDAVNGIAISGESKGMAKILIINDQGRISLMKNILAEFNINTDREIISGYSRESAKRGLEDATESLRDSEEGLAESIKTLSFLKEKALEICN